MAGRTQAAERAGRVASLQGGERAQAQQDDLTLHWNALRESTLLLKSLAYKNDRGLEKNRQSLKGLSKDITKLEKRSSVDSYFLKTAASISGAVAIGILCASKGASQIPAAESTAPQVPKAEASTTSTTKIQSALGATPEASPISAHSRPSVPETGSFASASASSAPLNLSGTVYIMHRRETGPESTKSTGTAIAGISDIIKTIGELGIQAFLYTRSPTQAAPIQTAEVAQDADLSDSDSDQSDI